MRIKRPREVEDALEPRRAAGQERRAVCAACPCCSWLAAALTGGSDWAGPCVHQHYHTLSFSAKGDS